MNYQNPFGDKNIDNFFFTLGTNRLILLCHSKIVHAELAEPPEYVPGVIAALVQQRGIHALVNRRRPEGPVLPKGRLAGRARPRPEAQVAVGVAVDHERASGAHRGRDLPPRLLPRRGGGRGARGGGDLSVWGRHISCPDQGWLQTGVSAGHVARRIRLVLHYEATPGEEAGRREREREREWHCTVNLDVKTLGDILGAPPSLGVQLADSLHTYYTHTHTHLCGRMTGNKSVHQAVWDRGGFLKIIQSAFQPTSA